ncbi:uncharacterized protein [Dysidea avara]|uniref:uncharacterized protein isoform X2 n=1 Tax=Dysidea avara TaxID=196820 RepID=UPI00332EA372
MEVGTQFDTFGQFHTALDDLKRNGYHHTFAMNCKTKITVSYDSLYKKLCVRHCHLEHTHQVGPAIFAHYPVNRRLTAAEEATISEMPTVKPNTKRVKELVEKKFGKCVTLKDISNLKTKVKEQTQKGLEERQLLLSALQLLPLPRMPKQELWFPEILFIDGTYNVNGHGMPLYCLE